MLYYRYSFVRVFNLLRRPRVCHYYFYTVNCQSSILNKFLLLTEFEDRTGSYGPSFSPSIYDPSTKHTGHIWKGKNEDL